MRRAGVAPGSLAIVVGAGGVGGYCVQIARAFGAQGRRHRRRRGQARRGRRPRRGADARRPRARRQGDQGRDQRVREGERPARRPSGSSSNAPARPPGQLTAYGLLVHGATLSVVGFTMDKVEVRLSNLMAFDARAIGNWGCPPELYPARSTSCSTARSRSSRSSRRIRSTTINDVFAAVHHRDIKQRVVLVPARLRRTCNERSRNAAPRSANSRTTISSTTSRSPASATRSARRRCPTAPVAAGLYNAWITLDNPTQFNSYTTDMVKGVILAFRAASNARDVAASCSPAPATRRSAPAATPRNTPSTTPGTRRSTGSTCGCSTTWCRRSSPATSR